MGRSKKEQREATTQLLLDVASELFAARGYGGVGLEEVAARAEVTRGALYHHFGSKEGLFSAVLERVQEEVGERVAVAASRAPDRWAELVAGCHAFLGAGSDPRVQRIMLVDAPAVLGWQRWRELDAAHSGRLLEQVLDELEHEGTIGAGLSAPLAPLLSGAMNEAALWIAQSPDPEQSLRAAGEALDRLLGSLRA